MTLSVTCRDCGHVNQVDPSQSGGKYLCNGCGMLETAPASTGESAEAAVLRFACPACGQKYATKPNLAGQKIRCKGCGAGVRVPGGGAVAGTARTPETSRTAMKSVDAPSGTSRPATVRASAPVPTDEEDDALSLLGDLAALEEVKGRERAESVLPSRSEAMDQVRQKVAEQEAADAQKQAEKAKKKRKKKKGSSYFDPKDTLILAGGVTGFVAVLAFLSWGYPDLRFPVGGFMCVLGFIVYLLGAASIKQVVAEEGFHHVVLFRFFPPYQWYFVATRWSETKDFFAFFAAGLIILTIGGAVIKTSPIGEKAEASERAYQKAQQGSVESEIPPAVVEKGEEEG